jgi:hypothetical protein
MDTVSLGETSDDSAHTPVHILHLEEKRDILFLQAQQHNAEIRSLRTKQGGSGMLSHQEELSLPKTYRHVTFFSIFNLLVALLSFLFCLTTVVFAVLFIANRLDQMISITFLVVGICIVAVLGLLVSCFSFIKLLSCRLILTDQGVIRYDLSERQFTPWSNIVGIGYQGRQKGLRLKEPAGCSNLEEGFQRNIPALAVSRRNWYRWDLHASFFPIPKEISEQDWENGALGAYLRRYGLSLHKEQAS